MSRLVLLLSLFTIVFLSPVIVLVIYSFAPSWSFPEIVPEVFNTRSFTFVYDHRKNIGFTLLSSCTYSFLTIALTLLMTILPANVFARNEFRGKYLVEGLFLVPALVPPMAFAMGAHYMFIHIGLADTLPGVVLVLALFSYPYMLRALMAGYQVCDERYGQCARNLGASNFRVLLNIELPLLLPAVIAGGTIVFLVSFSEYFLVMLIGGGNVPSYSGYIFPLLNSSDKSIASVLTLLFLAVPILLFILVDRLLNSMYRKRGLV